MSGGAQVLRLCGGWAGMGCAADLLEPLLCCVETITRSHLTKGGVDLYVCRRKSLQAQPAHVHVTNSAKGSAGVQLPWVMHGTWQRRHLRCQPITSLALHLQPGRPSTHQCCRWPSSRRSCWCIRRRSGPAPCQGGVLGGYTRSKRLSVHEVQIRQSFVIMLFGAGPAVLPETAASC